MGYKPRTRKHAALALIETDRGQAFVADRLREVSEQLARLEMTRDALAALARTERQHRPKRTKRTKRKVAPARILKALETRGEPMLRRELEAELGANADRVKQTLEQLVEAGDVNKVGRGRGTRYEVA